MDWNRCRGDRKLGRPSCIVVRRMSAQPKRKVISLNATRARWFAFGMACGISLWLACEMLTVFV